MFPYTKGIALFLNLFKFEFSMSDWPLSWGQFYKTFCALRPTFAPYAQLLRSYFEAQKFGVGRKNSA